MNIEIKDLPPIFTRDHRCVIEREASRCRHGESFPCPVRPVARSDDAIGPTYGYVVAVSRSIILTVTVYHQRGEDDLLIVGPVGQPDLALAEAYEEAVQERDDRSARD